MLSSEVLLQVVPSFFSLSLYWYCTLLFYRICTKTLSPLLAREQQLFNDYILRQILSAHFPNYNVLVCISEEVIPILEGIILIVTKNFLSLPEKRIGSWLLLTEQRVRETVLKHLYLLLFRPCFHLLETKNRDYPLKNITIPSFYMHRKSIILTSPI